MADNSNSEQLMDKLNRALRSKAVLAEKSRLLEQQAEDARRREDNQNHVVSELLDRQRESNYMLHRANSVLHRLQETNLALSSEFTELVKELPAPNTPDWEQRVAKINDLFRKTGELAEEVQDEVFRRGGISEKSAPMPVAKPVEPAPEPVVAPAAVTEVEDTDIEEPEVSVPLPEPEQVLVAEEVEPEPLIVAEVVESEPMLAAEVIEPEPVTVEGALRVSDELEHIEAVFTPPDPDAIPEHDDRLDRLFHRVQASEPGHRRPKGLLEDDEETASAKPSLLDRFKERFLREPKNAENRRFIDKAS